MVVVDLFLKSLGRKGQVEEMVEQVPYIILTLIVLAAIYALLAFVSNPKIDTADVQAQVFMYRVLYSPGSISFESQDFNSPNPVVIDDSKFNSQTLDALMKYGYDRQVSARLTIYLVDEGRRASQIRVAYYNEDWFKRLEQLASAPIQGSGSAKIFTKSLPVVLRQEGVDSSAFLKMEVVIPN
jgi:hypothetical protein